MPHADRTERNSERMNFRTKPHVKQTIHRAAVLAGMDDSAFAINAAYRAAIETIELHERTQLAQADHADFFSALDNPPQPADKLRDAFARHGRSISSA